MMNLHLLFPALFLILSTSIIAQSKNINSLHTDKESKNTARQDNYIKILWLDQNGKLQLNENYIKTVSDQQRAALGYIAIDVGNECHWDGDKKADKSNLKCILLSALNLGYQCSETHLSFLKKWFKDDKKVLERLQYCNKTESSEKIQDGFTELKMATTANTIKIIYSAVGTDKDKNNKWNWTEESSYSFAKTEIKQIYRKNINGAFN